MSAQILRARPSFPSRWHGIDQDLPAESDGPPQQSHQHSDRLSPVFNSIQTLTPESPKSFFYPQSGTGLRPVPIPWSHHVHSLSNRSEPPQRPEIHRPDFCHRQGHVFHERLQNRHPRQIPRPSLREPRRPRPTHRRLLPPSPPTRRITSSCNPPRKTPKSNASAPPKPSRASCRSTPTTSRRKPKSSLSTSANIRRTRSAGAPRPCW